jgi:hypothetical protein
VKPGNRNSAVLVALALGAGVVVPLVTGPAAFAYPHGCVVSANEHTEVPPEIADPDGAIPLEPGDCFFRFYPGDTYTGFGSFTISCTGVGPYVVHADTDVPAVDVVLPCPDHTFPQVHAETGAFVYAGAPLNPNIIQTST